MNLPSSSQPTYQSKNGYAISPITPTTNPLRVLVAFVVFTPDGSGNCNLPGGSCWSGNNLPFQPNDYFDDQPSVAPATPTAYYSKYLSEASFGKFQVIGDCIKKTVHLPCSLVSNIYPSPSDYKVLSDAAFKDQHLYPF